MADLVQNPSQRNLDLTIGIWKTWQTRIHFLNFFGFGNRDNRILELESQKNAIESELERMRDRRVVRITDAVAEKFKRNK